MIQLILTEDDDAFPRHKVSLTVPAPVDMLKHSRIIGSSHGLMCLYSDYGETAVLWNISIRKVVAVNVPNVGDYGRYEAVLGFGVCGFGETNDPKIVKITPIVMDCTSSIPWQIDVFTLSTGAWRRLYSTNLPRKSLKFNCSLLGVVVDGAFCWLATDRITMDGERRSINLIISFDLTSEEFKEINPPDALAHLQRLHLSMSKLRESLFLIEGYLSNDHVFHVWMMEDGVPKLFTKMFTICTPGAVVLGVLEFRKSGEPIIEILDSSCDPFEDDSSLVVYEPYSKHITNLGIRGMCSFYLSSYMGSCLRISGMCSFSSSSYKETLLLHDHPDLTTYDISKWIVRTCKDILLLTKVLFKFIFNSRSFAFNL
ncbi:putative F-box associated interaction domain-containing protein [Helianthus annuus]|nr:putative F-box associated interaction domain-containing protein [Helianthus annuus]KAJ0742139.1 putative F-box associated interaction domain-containing protein [Helianthus annuus]